MSASIGTAMRSVFIVGDSISMHYGPYLKRMVAGKLHYDRKRGPEQSLADLDEPVGANGGDSKMVLNYLQGEHSRGVRYDLLMINCGLHDIKTDPASGQKQVPLDRYRRHLQEIIDTARHMASSIIWIRTTDVVDEIHNRKSTSFSRYHEDVTLYNEAADAIMREHGIPLIDLYHLTRVFGDTAYIDHVHYTEEVRRLQAAYIAGYLDQLT